MDLNNLTDLEKLMNNNTSDLTPEEKLKVLLSDNPLETLKTIINGK